VAVDNQSKRFAPGFQGSENSGVELHVYSHGDDPFIQSSPGEILFDGKTQTDKNPSIVSVQYQKMLGQPSSNFTVQVQDPNNTIRDKIADDDWVDLTFTRHGEKYHILRGMIDTIRENVTIINGASENVLVVSGRDHGKVWEQTQVFFNRFLATDGRAVFNDALEKGGGIAGNPAKTVFAILKFFLARLSRETLSPSWTLPGGIPNIPQGSAFTDVIDFNDRNGGYTNGIGFTNTPPRVAVNAFNFDPSGNQLWDLAQSWSDPQYCEMYTELVDAATGGIPDPGKAVDRTGTQMALIFRDRPFPHGVGGSTGAWFDLPTFTLTRQDLAGGTDIGRGGEERLNTFFAKIKGLNETKANQVELTGVLADLESIKRHGPRIMSTVSDYQAAPPTSLAAFVRYQRSQLCDWFSLNPVFLNGTLPLARGFPDIRVGTRVRVLGDRGDESNITYYVEGVSHDWNLVGGMRTTLTVTRGWRGTDESLREAIDKARSLYTVIDGDPSNPDIYRGTPVEDLQIG